tara:strand:+ start:636 stop:986 length:351 start_codon:yes stop_codon:yes gene_type:complete
VKIILILTLLLSTASECLPYSYETGGSADGAMAAVYVNIQPDLGWKWNEKYPSTFKIKYKDGVATPNYVFGDGKIRATFAPRKNDTSAVTVVATFGLCTKIVCRAFRNQEFKISYL